MKRISKNKIKQLQHSQAVSNIIFQQNQTIAQPGHFVNPSSQICFQSQKLQIICKGYGKNAVGLANHVLLSLKTPLLVLTDEKSKINQQEAQILGSSSGQLTHEQKQKYFILNLIDSCFEELSQKDYQGSCSFGIAYISNNQINIAKTSIIQCYLISKNEHSKYSLENIHSKNLPFLFNTLSDNPNQDQNSKPTEGFVTCSKNYENIMSKKYFPQVNFAFLDMAKRLNSIFLMGNSECFSHFSEQELINFFHSCPNIHEAGSRLIQSSKKTWKTIYQQDMSLVLSKFGLFKN